MSRKFANAGEVETSSGNVFEDLGAANADVRLAKGLLSRTIQQVIAQRGWSQAKAAREIGLAQSDMSDVVRGKLGKFSLERLESIILDLDMDIHMRVSPKKPSAARGHVSVELVIA